MNKLLYKKVMNRGGAFKQAPILKADVVDEEKHIVLVKFCSFGTVDSDGDMLMKGCISKSIQERGPASATNRKIQFLWQHETKNPIGRILSIDVKAGDTVKAGQEVLVLEAMKMENSIATDYAGKVKQILVEVGENVATDAVLMEIE